MRRAPSRGRQRSPARKFVWARNTGVITLAPNSVNRQNALAGFEALYGAQLIGATVINFRGVACCFAAGPASRVENVRFAAIVQPNPGSAAVVADGPVGGENNDWMMYEPFQALVSSASITAGVNDVNSRVIYSKASRRLDEIGDTLFLYTATPAANVNSVTFQWDLSIGLKLP